MGGALLKLAFLFSFLPLATKERILTCRIVRSAGQQLDDCSRFVCQRAVVCIAPCGLVLARFYVINFTRQTIN